MNVSKERFWRDSIILLCSGNLGAIALRQLQATKCLKFVFTDKASKNIIQFCIEQSIPFYEGNPRTSHAGIVISTLSCEVLLSVNYLFVVEANVLSIPRKYAINFHGSLLPKYRGRTPHVWAIINGEKETGITAHLMNDAVDNGPIVKQVKVPIEENDTGYDVLKKFNDYYPNLIQSILEDIQEDKLVVTEQEHWRATYFGKRTPEDGAINWNWQKERIHNWVRAQADPYPGAFCYYEDEKIIVNQILFSDHGFSEWDINGLILVGGREPIVKTPNGAVQLANLKLEKTIEFTTGKCLICQTL